MIYTSYQDMADVIRRNVWKVPADVDLIVGIPRSGMIPALMLAELLNVRCTDLDSFLEGRVMSCGGRGRLIRGDQKGRVLVLDDTVFFGNALNKARERLAPVADDHDIIYGCIYAEGKHAKEMVDLYFHDIYQPGEKNWLYEWNVLHHYSKNTESAMWDIDGLLCKDPPDDHNQEAYERYLPNAIPMIIPTTHVGAFVTYRLERYRGITEDWLRRHGIDYGQLLMFPSHDREERNHTQSPARFKAKAYAAAHWAKTFYESEARQAERIHQLTGKPVFCYETGKFYI